jgi:lipopolysaccharide export system protein LptA
LRLARTSAGALIVVRTGEGSHSSKAGSKQVTQQMATIGNLCVAVVAVLALACINAVAEQGPPNALQGLSTNRDKPVNIQAASLEVRDKDKIATFTGNVRVIQGETNMRCKTLVVHYDGTSATGAMTAQPGSGGAGQIRRMEAQGGVVLTQKDQIATGDRGEFDVRTNTVTLIGNVVVKKGRDVLEGPRLVVNLTTGVLRMESDGSGQPINMLIDSLSGDKPDRNQGKASRPAPPR